MSVMDLNAAIHAAECGGHVRDDSTMIADWTMRYVKEEKLLYYFNPQGEKRHKVQFSNKMRTSFQWRTVP
jgi:hypothetical protein